MFEVTSSIQGLGRSALTLQIAFEPRPFGRVESFGRLHDPDFVGCGAVSMKAASRSIHPPVPGSRGGATGRSTMMPREWVWARMYWLRSTRVSTTRP